MSENKKYIMTKKQFTCLFKDKKFPVIVNCNIPFEFVGNEKVREEIQKELDKTAERICERVMIGTELS